MDELDEMTVIDAGARDEGRPADGMGAPKDLASALDLWVQLTGVEPRERGTGGRYTMGQLSLQRLHEEIAESLELDRSETTGRMLMSLIVQEYLAATSFTAEELLNRPEAATTYLERARRLTGFLRGPEVAGRGDEFADTMLQALQRYGALTPEVRGLVEQRGPHGDRGMLAVLRRDAMRTVSKLQVSQFLDGEPEAPDARPAYGRFLYRWANINSMLKAMVTAPSGVTVNMIQSSGNPYGVHFVFAIRNGGRMFVFTDKEQTPHPLAEGMWRRPDKVLAERANRNWFPYDVAGLKFNEEGRAYIETSRGRSIASYQTEVQPVKPLSDLSPPQIIWLVMMLDLIVEKFWRQDYRAKQLSFTGEMVGVATPLVEAAKAAGLPVVVSGRALLEVGPITMADVVSDAVNESDVGSMAGVENRWLEERYKHLVAEGALDVVQEVQGSLLLTSAGKVVPESEVVGGLGHFAREERLQKLVKVEALDPESFGTAEELRKNRLFLARANYAGQIEAHAQREFSERKEEIKKWVQEHMLRNLPKIETMLAASSVWVTTRWSERGWEDRCSNVRYSKDGTREFMRRVNVQESKDYLYMLAGGEGNVVACQHPWKDGAPSCHYTGAPSAFMVSLVPETAEQLAWLCGVGVGELPDVLQTWCQLRKERRNHLLNRVDPMDWKVQNPWTRRLPLQLNVFVSKRSMRRLEKRLADEGMHEPPGYVAGSSGKA